MGLEQNLTVKFLGNDIHFYDFGHNMVKFIFLKQYVEIWWPEGKSGFASWRGFEWLSVNVHFAFSFLVFAILTH